MFPVDGAGAVTPEVEDDAVSRPQLEAATVQAMNAATRNAERVAI
jgi:hypothetical protein